MGIIQKGRSNSASSKVLYDRGGRPYRLKNGNKDYLSWEESHGRMKAYANRLKHELHNSALSLSNAEHRLQWKDDEIDKLKHELEVYQIASLQEENVLRQAVAQIGRVLHNQDRYTKKQLLEQMDTIFSKLSPNGLKQE